MSGYLDATEFFITTPKQSRTQGQTYSEYKSHNTFKTLIGVTPTGMISFVSELWSGNCSDVRLCKESKLLGPSGLTFSTFVAPAFLNGRAQLSDSEIVEMRRVANLRIHIERSIGRLKRFRFLHEMRGVQ
eukprot:Pompholyxophrys_punicea_v1_NODE_864_length_1196_cov_14.426819.p1 type:complete len:130 gc:universal NODE_864_length_1196_cov_14.426819:693-1082(+)